MGKMGGIVLEPPAEKVLEKMNFSVIKRDEVRIMYEQAADKKMQIRNMADLMACEEADICDVLGIPHTKERKHGRIDEIKAEQLRKKGATDKEIAEANGVTKEAVKAWKWRNGLMKLSEEKKAKYAHCRELYDQGMNDFEIAEQTGLNRKSVCDWRKQNKLPAHKKPIKDWELQDERFMPLYAQGMSDTEIGNRFGVNFWNVRTWRRMRGLAPNCPKNKPRKSRHGLSWEDKDRKYRPLYERGLNDTQIAELTGTNKWVIGDWRRKFNLPVQGRKGK